MAWENLIQSSEICTDGFTLTDVFFPWNMGMRKGNYLCNKYMGNITIIENMKMWYALSSQMNHNWDINHYRSFNALDMPLPNNLSKNISEEVDIWTGFSDIEIEGNFVDIVEANVSFNYSLFAKGEPNGKRRENCVEIRNKYGWNDDPCSVKKAFFCRMGQNPVFQIRGTNLGYK